MYAFFIRFTEVHCCNFYKSITLITVLKRYFYTNPPVQGTRRENGVDFLASFLRVSGRADFRRSVNTCSSSLFVGWSRQPVGEIL